jgi:hypothetical protein
MPFENVGPKRWEDTYINVAIADILISDTIAVVIAIVQLAKIHKKKNGFWQDKLH